jgi:signal transduction histidine kinase
MVTVASSRSNGLLVSRLAVPVTVVGYAAAVVALTIAIHAGDWGNLGPLMLPVMWLVAASLAVRARPDHPGALLFVCLGTGHLIGFALGLPIALDRTANGWAVWSTNLIGLLSYSAGFAALAAFLATYPSGRPHSRAERGFLPFAFGVAVLATVVDVVTSSRVELVVSAKRATMAPPAGLPVVSLPLPVGAFVPLLVIVGAVLLVVRGRHAEGEERRQLTWATGAGGLLALMIAISPLLSALVSSTFSSVVFLVVASIVPFVLLAGLVRYRLMDVDVYVTRTLASGAAGALALAAYAVVAAVSADDRAATAALVVVAALTGTPLVRWLTRLADRWFSGGRVRGQALIRHLAESLSDSSRADIARRTTSTVAAGLEVSWVRLVCDDLDVSSGTGMAGEPAVTVPLSVGEERVGRIDLGPRHGGWSPTELAEVELLARHAALALHNADLSTRLAAQVEELRASRLRIVRAELDVRRRLEHDLHDGVQQQVVALIAHLGALRVMIAPDSQAGVVVSTAQRQASLCLSDLRAVLSGVHPPVLLDQGVVAAVESRAVLLPLAVRVESSLRRRYPAETEAAAYYVVSEALTNVVKHAAAGRAQVSFSPAPQGALCVSVRDDGVGMSPESATRGLSALRDRVEALGGRLTVESRPGHTCVSARLPTAEVSAHV